MFTNLYKNLLLVLNYEKKIEHTSLENCPVLSNTESSLTPVFLFMLVPS